MSIHETTFADRRKNVLIATAAALEAKGFTTELVELGTLSRLRISHPSVGIVAALKTTSLRFDGAKLFGGLAYDGRLHSQRDSEFRLDANGQPNISNLVARLRKDIPLVQQQSARQAASRAREASDNAILEALPMVEGADRQVWDGQVDLKLHNLTPSQAKAILVLLAERQAELVDDRDNQVERDLADEANDR